eukprot:766329-Hanusia_phi.AAC.2
MTRHQQLQSRHAVGPEERIQGLLLDLSPDVVDVVDDGVVHDEDRSSGDDDGEVERVGRATRSCRRSGAG